MIKAIILAIACMATIAFVALAVAPLVFIARATRDPVIVIENASSSSLEQIVCTLLANGTKWTERKNELERGRELEFSKSTSDLFILSMEYEFQGEPRHWQEGGVATPGETYRLRLGPQGDVSASYDP